MAVVDVAEERDRTLLRLGGVCAVAGGLLAVVGNVLHPRPADGVELGDPAGYAQEVIGAGQMWLFAHLTLIAVSVLFLLFWACVVRAVGGGRPQAVALLALAVAVIDTALHIVTLTLDGMVMHRAAYALDPSDAGELASFRALYHLLFGLFAGWQILWGITFVLFGAALLLSPRWPRWTGALPVVAGALVSVIGVVDSYRGAGDFTFLIAFPVLAATLSLWVIWVGLRMMRQPTPRGADLPPAPPAPSAPPAPPAAAAPAEAVAAAPRPPSPAVSRFVPVGAVGGIVFVIGLLAGIIAVPPSPRADASAADVVTYFVTERSAVLTGGVMTALAALGYFAYIAAIYGRLQGADPRERVLPGAIAIASAVQIAMVVLSSVCFWALAGRIATEADPDVSLAVFVLGMKIYSALDLGAPVVFAALGLAVLRTGIFARWLGVAMLALAVPAAALGVVGPLVSSGPLAPQGPVDVIATLGFLTWVLVTSVLLLRESRQPGRAPEQHLIATTPRS